MEKQQQEESPTTLPVNKKAWKDPELLELSAETTFGGIEPHPTEDSGGLMS